MGKNLIRHVLVALLALGLLTSAGAAQSTSQSGGSNAMKVARDNRNFQQSETAGHQLGHYRPTRCAAGNRRGLCQEDRGWASL